MKSNRFRAAAVPAVGVLMMGLMSLGATTTASASTLAHPTGCHYETPGAWGAVAWCDNHNGGSYRVNAVCKDEETGKTEWWYGPWRQNGWSIGYCQGSYRAISSGIETSSRNNT